MKSAKAIAWEETIERSAGREISCIFFYEELDPDEHLALLKKIADTVSKARLLYKTEKEAKDMPAPFFKEMLNHPKLEFRFMSREKFEAVARTMMNLMKEGITVH